MIKKQLIMEKALELFAKQGFEATSVQQITEHCGISKGAFYLSFKSKDELIVALIDHFMEQIISNIDYVVRNENQEVLLYEFYHALLDTFYKHSDFAKILIKEQSHTFNKELFLKIQSYDQLIDKSILSMIDRLYGKEINHIKFDLIYCIKGFMQTYSHLFIFFDVPIDLKLLSQSLVEKTNILARHSTVPFITKDLIQLFSQPMSEGVSKEQIVGMIDEKIQEIDEPIIKESLTLIRQELIEPNFSPAIVKGLLENIRNHPHCNWISYLLRNYFDV